MQNEAGVSLDVQGYLGDRSLADWREQYDRDGYLLFERVLDPEQLAQLRTALAPSLEADVQGRNDFEGFRTNRVYAMLAKSPLFAELCCHALPLAFAEAELGESCLLSACLAINLQPGESAQPWHFDDAHLAVPRPRPAWGLSAFWILDDTTADNGATEIIPGSHHWPEDEIPGSIGEDSLGATAMREGPDPGARDDALAVCLPAGSLMLAKGTLWHRGGANRTEQSRLIITPQYCPGWARQLENMVLAVPPEQARQLPLRAQELLGYSIHPPFMGYVDGMHPRRLLS